MRGGAHSFGDKAHAKAPGEGTCPGRPRGVWGTAHSPARPGCRRACPGGFPTRVAVPGGVPDATAAGRCRRAGSGVRSRAGVTGPERVREPAVRPGGVATSHGGSTLHRCEGFFAGGGRPCPARCAWSPVLTLLVSPRAAPVHPSPRMNRPTTRKPPLPMVPPRLTVRRPPVVPRPAGPRPVVRRPAVPRPPVVPARTGVGPPVVPAPPEGRVPGVAAVPRAAAEGRSRLRQVPPRNAMTGRTATARTGEVPAATTTGSPSG